MSDPFVSRHRKMRRVMECIDEHAPPKNRSEDSCPPGCLKPVKLDSKPEYKNVKCGKFKQARGGNFGIEFGVNNEFSDSCSKFVLKGVDVRVCPIKSWLIICLFSNIKFLHYFSWSICQRMIRFKHLSAISPSGYLQCS